MSNKASNKSLDASPRIKKQLSMSKKPKKQKDRPYQKSGNRSEEELLAGDTIDHHYQVSELDSMLSSQDSIASTPLRK